MPVRRAAAFAVICAAVLSACGGSSASSSASATSLSTGATGSPNSSSAATTTTVPLQPQPTATDAASAFMAAWRAGDQVAAATLAPASVVQSAFAAGVPSSVQSRGCSSGNFDPTMCVYRTDLGEAQVRATKQGDGWIVDQVKVTPA